MMAPLLNPAQNKPPGRISQLLPTVKCSNCSKPVALNELSDHVCSTPPPVPTLPKPSVSPAAVASLLPPHLQNRLGSPTALSPRTPSPNDIRFSPVPQRSQEEPQPLHSPSERLRINTAASTSNPYPTRSSPLTRTLADRHDVSFPGEGPRLGPARVASNSLSPLRTRPPNDLRGRANSNAGPASIFTSSPPTTARPPPPSQAPSIQHNVRFDPPHGTLQHIPSRATPSPQISEREIDTKTGGEAGMAGVGRRGFAAAARAAMFTAPMDRPLPPVLQLRRDNSPYPNADFPSHPNETPPLSPGSGYSSHSPGVSPYPQSPVGQQGLPSPDRSNVKAPPRPSHAKVPSVDKFGLPSSPQSLRMPFEQSKSEITAVAQNAPLAPAHDATEARTPLTAKQTPFPVRPRDSESAFSASSYSQSARSRSQSTSTNSSQQNTPRYNRPPSPTSESGSEYGGLAYANSTDGEEELHADSKNIKGKANPPPPLRLGSILRSGSTSGSSHVRFPSASTAASRPTHKRDLSNSSVSSVSSVSSSTDEARKSNSAAIAHALGLSQTSPSSYRKLGGPGVGIGGRSASGSSSGGRSAYSRGGHTTSGSSAGVMEKELKTLLEHTKPGLPAEERVVGLTKSQSMKRNFGASGEGSDVNSNGEIKVPLTAMQPSTSAATIKSRTDEKRPGIAPLQPSGGMKVNSEASVMPSKEKKEKVRKPKTCLKCDDKIMDGRWVQVDNGGVLCVTCWKHMYLPKCRRCNLPIEKQAVSSSDGQLKGKYHRDCFNCHQCHAPFPDKSFYVFDGKPLCAYHYHEANDSLCAAARCGQPIEGPCAVSHTGDRYHPEHMTCEYPGNQPCNKKLEEYWEVDGRMLCEYHAQVGDEDEDGAEYIQSSKALKRVTRYIDLAGSGGESGLR